MRQPGASAETFEGGCHCGAVRFRISLKNRKALACNCSICAKKGFVNIIVAADDFELLHGADDLVSYRFNTKVAEHTFCRTCGIHSFSRPRSHPSDYDVNGRCLDAGVDMLEITPFDGKHWEQNVDSIR